MKIECSSATPWGIHLTLVDHQCPHCGWAVEKPATKEEPASFFKLAARRLRAFAVTRRAA